MGPTDHWTIAPWPNLPYVDHTEPENAKSINAILRRRVSTLLPSRKMLDAVLEQQQQQQQQNYSHYSITAIQTFRQPGEQASLPESQTNRFLSITALTMKTTKSLTSTSCKNGSGSREKILLKNLQILHGWRGWPAMAEGSKHAKRIPSALHHRRIASLRPMVRTGRSFGSEPSRVESLPLLPKLDRCKVWIRSTGHTRCCWKLSRAS